MEGCCALIFALPALFLLALVGKFTGFIGKGWKRDAHGDYVIKKRYRRRKRLF